MVKILTEKGPPLRLGRTGIGKNRDGTRPLPSSPEKPVPPPRRILRVGGGTEGYRLMFMSSVSIWSAVVMTRELAW